MSLLFLPVQQACLIAAFSKVRHYHDVCCAKWYALLAGPLVDWISDTLSQGYTGLQSLVKCLDHRDIMSDTACSQAKVVYALLAECESALSARASVHICFLW